MFVGRDAELSRLERHYAKGTFQMAVVYGRRRVGKTTLIGEFCKGKRTLAFTALEQADADNLADFSREIARFFGMPLSTRFSSWRDALEYVADKAADERFVFVFDEFPYAAKRCPALPSILQVVIDHKLLGTDAFVFLCGSNQGAMESDVLGRESPLYGRRTIQMKLKPLDYLEAARMTPNASADEAFRYYACMGGVPYYLAQIDEGMSFQENLAELFFDPSGFLFGEPQMLLRQELSEPAAYNSVLRAIASGATRPKEIADRTGIAETSLPGYLSTLCELDLVERSVPFGENPEKSRKGLYRIREAAFDFWFSFVMPNNAAIEAGLGQVAAQSVSEEALSTYLGRRFERVCLEWVARESIGGNLPFPITRIGQWWGADPSLKEQVDIDVVAADGKTKRAIVGECKYRISFDETEAIETLRHRAGLLKSYMPEQFMLFSKRELSSGSMRKLSADPSVHSVTLEQMYALER